MNLEVKRRTSPCGAVFEQLYIVRHKDGKRKRTYVRGGDAQRVISEYKERLALRRPKPQKPPKGSVRPGRKSILPPALYELSRLAGYNRLGVQLHMSHADFRKPECAAVRFQLLDDSAKAAVGSPERLHQATVMATSLWKRRNRYSIPTTFDRCMAEVLATTEA